MAGRASRRDSHERRDCRRRVRRSAANEPTVGQLAAQAAELVRTLNHLTRPGVGALTDPAEVCELVAELACLTRRLPQLFAQISGWLHGEGQAGRLRVDAFSPVPDPAAAVTVAIGCLARPATARTAQGAPSMARSNISRT